MIQASSPGSSPRTRASRRADLRVTIRAARWVMLLVPASLYVFSWVHRVAPAVVAADLMRAFSITAAALGNLAAIYPYVFAAMALVAGSLADTPGPRRRSEEHTSELQSQSNLVCRLLLEKKKIPKKPSHSSRREPN